MTARWGYCVVCGRYMRVNKDDTVRHHGGPLREHWPYGREYRCPGAGRPAVGRPS